MSSSLPGRGLGGGPAPGEGPASRRNHLLRDLSAQWRNRLGVTHGRAAILGGVTAAAAAASPSLPADSGDGWGPQSQSDALRTRASSWRLLQDEKRRITDIMLLLNC
ncbi:hypothetical protein DUNSADRAFT_8734, partial [Dunaliella salina]